MQLGSSPTTLTPRRRYGARASTVRRSTRRAVASCPVEIQVRPQHSGCSGTITRQPAASRTSTAALPIPGVRWLVNVSGHSTISPRSPDDPGSCLPIQACRVCGAKSGIVSVLIYASGYGQQVAQDRCLGQRVDQPRGPGRELGYGGQPAHRVVGPRAQPPGVVVGQELGLHGGHVHLDRAVLLAALAGQAQVERVADLGGAPARGDRGVGVPLEHLEQQPARPRVECSSSLVTM